LTSGSVLFSNGTTIAQKNASFFWDNTNNRLGIGTTSPVNPLHVVGSVIAIRASLPSGDGCVLSNDSTTSYFQALTVDNLVRNFNIAGQNIFFRSGASSYSERMRIADTGNVLIGTTTDAGFKLDVNGTMRVSNFAYFTAYATSVQRVQFNNGLTSGNFGYLKSGSNGVIQLSDSSEADFNRLQFGGSNASFPAIKRASNNLEIKNANDTFGAGLSIGASLDASAILQADSTTRGFLPPRMTTTQKNAIASPASGLVIYDTTLGKLCVRGASAWETITSI
jgi:hypothetical protein